jgi:hypothetical protein
MVEQEKSPVKGGILGDGCGLGKTLEALLLVYLSSKTERPKGQAFKPTLSHGGWRSLADSRLGLFLHYGRKSGSYARLQVFIFARLLMSNKVRSTSNFGKL